MSVLVTKITIDTSAFTAALKQAAQSVARFTAAYNRLLAMPPHTNSSPRQVRLERRAHRRAIRNRYRRRK